MSEPRELNSLPALAGVKDERERVLKRPPIASVRVSPGPYLAVGCVITFFAAILLRAQYDVLSVFAVAFTWIVIPLLALTDRIVFDGALLRRVSGDYRNVNCRWAGCLLWIHFATLPSTLWRG